ncbi:MAG: hypothetical protein ACLQUT_05330 [Thermoleophilia bacterium]
MPDICPVCGEKDTITYLSGEERGTIITDRQVVSHLECVRTLFDAHADLQEQNTRLENTNRRLNRRAQLADAAVRQVVEHPKTQRMDEYLTWLEESRREADEDLIVLEAKSDRLLAFAEAAAFGTNTIPSITIESASGVSPTGYFAPPAYKVADAECEGLKFEVES